MRGHALNVWHVAFSPDGRLVATSSFDDQARARGQRAAVRTLASHKEAIVGCAFRPDGRLLASGSDDSTIRLWRVADVAHLKTPTGGTSHVYTVPFSSDSQWLATGGREKGAAGTLWKQIAGEHIRGKSGANDPALARQ